MNPEAIPPSEVVPVEPWEGETADYIREVARRIRMNVGPNAQGQDFKDLLTRATDMLDSFANMYEAVKEVRPLSR